MANSSFNIGDTNKAIDTLSDQITTLNSNIAMKDSLIQHTTSATSHSFTVPENSCNLVIVSGLGGSRVYAGVIYNSSSNITELEIAKGNNVTVTTSGNTITFAFNDSRLCSVRCVNVHGGTLS